MAIDIYVPPLSQTEDTLVIAEWVKEVGEAVTKGEVLFKVETDKAVLEVEAPASGILSAVLAEAGETVRVRSVIGSIAVPGEVLEAPGPGGETLPPERQKRIFASPRARQMALLKGLPLEALQGGGSGPGGLIVERDVTAHLQQRKVTPLARRAAEVDGVDLSRVTPARPGAAITRADVAAISSQPSSTMEGTVPLSPTRKVIARRMQESHLTSAPVTYMTEVDATRLVKLRKRLLKDLPEGAARPTYTDFIVYLTCRALAKHPELNATLDGETLTLHQGVHMGLAVDTERGLIVPVIREVERLGIAEIAHQRIKLVERAVAGSITPGELSGGTFTLSNLGTLGIDHFTPIINPPQVAVLGVGRIREAPAARKGKVRIRKLMGLALTCDHRVVDGAPAARFLQEVGTLIASPDLVWL